MGIIRDGPAKSKQSLDLAATSLKARLLESGRVRCNTGEI